MPKPIIVFFPKIEKKSKKSNLIPLIVRIRNGKQKTEATLDVQLDPNDLVFWNPITQRLDKPQNRINTVIESVAYEFSSLPFIERERFNYMTPQQIKDRILPNRPTPVNNIKLIGYVEDYYKNIVIPSTQYSKGTEKNYNKSINHLIKFLTYKKIRNILLSDFNIQHASQFNDYLMSNIPTIGKKAMSKVSATSVFIKIKTMLRRACLEEKIKRNPFTGIKLEKISPKRQRLTVSELSKFYQLDLTNFPNLEIDRDCFLFQVYTGLSYKDLYELKKSDIIVSNQGYFLNISRIKTNNPVQQFLIEPAIQLIKKYENDPVVLFKNRVLPCKHLNRYNSNLKILASMCEISKNLSTHIARHTCCQLLGNAGVRHLPVLNCILGWSNSQKSMSFTYNAVYDENLIEARDSYYLYLKNNL